MRFARWTFTGAGVYGICVLAPLYFVEKRLGLDYPPAVTHPEFYYGFAGTALAFQLVFLLIGRDPIRYRPLMIPSVCEKLFYGVAALALHAQGRLSGPPLAGALADLALGALFIAAYLKTRPDNLDD